MIRNVTHAMNRVPVFNEVIDRLLEGLQGADRQFILDAVNELQLNNRPNLLTQAAELARGMTVVNRELMLRLFSEIDPQEEEALFALVNQEIATWPVAIENTGRVWIIHTLDNIDALQRETALLHTRLFIDPTMAPVAIDNATAPTIGTHIAHIIESVNGVDLDVLNAAQELIQTHGIREHRDQVIAELAEITDEQRADVLTQVDARFPLGNGAEAILPFIRDVIDLIEAAEEEENSDSDTVEMEMDSDTEIDDSDDITRQ